MRGDRGVASYSFSQSYPFSVGFAAWVCWISSTLKTYICVLEFQTHCSGNWVSFGVDQTWLSITCEGTFIL